MFKSEMCVLERCYLDDVYVSTCHWNNSELSDRNQNSDAKMVPYPDHKFRLCLKIRLSHRAKGTAEVWEKRVFGENRESSWEEWRCHSQIPQRSTRKCHRVNRSSDWLGHNQESMFRQALGTQSSLGVAFSDSPSSLTCSSDSSCTPQENIFRKLTYRTWRGS